MQVVELKNGNKMVTFEWSNKYGDCMDCSAPAAYEVYRFNSDEKYDKCCSVCAAVEAAFGIKIRLIDKEFYAY